MYIHATHPLFMASYALSSNESSTVSHCGGLHENNGELVCLIEGPVVIFHDVHYKITFLFLLTASNHV